MLIWTWLYSIKKANKGEEKIKLSIWIEFTKRLKPDHRMAGEKKEKVKSRLSIRATNTKMQRTTSCTYILRFYCCRCEKWRCIYLQVECNFSFVFLISHRCRIRKTLDTMSVQFSLTRANSSERKTNKMWNVFYELLYDVLQWRTHVWMNSKSSSQIAKRKHERDEIWNHFNFIKTYCDDLKAPRKAQKDYIFFSPLVWKLIS